MENKNNELVYFIKDIIISGVNLKDESKVGDLLDKYMQQGEKLFSIPDVSERLSALASEKKLREFIKRHNATSINGKSEYVLAWRTCHAWIKGDDR